MKKLGLIGGVGPESTIDYYRQIIKEYQTRLITNDYPRILINSINMTKMLSCVFDKRYDDLINLLIDEITILEKAGIDFVAIASNTPHVVFDQLSDCVKIPIISIVEETCKFAGYKKIRRAGLLGTKTTMTSGFYQKVAEKYSIKIIIPQPENQDFIHDKYLSELVFNNIVPDTKNRFIEIVGELKETESIDGLILGGTELSLILNQNDFNDIEVFDTTMIHVKSIVLKMLE
jgi:aspartate racemase